MASKRKLSANRTNAKRSTGPRSTEGKAATSRNALRHGLAKSITHFETAQVEVKELTTAILKSFNGQGDIEFATRVAEAQIDLNRIRFARHTALTRSVLTSSITGGSELWLGGKGDEALSQSKQDRNQPQHKMLVALPNSVSESESHLTAERVAQLTAELLTIDRYEKRALSRRKFAVRDFDSSLPSSFRR